MSHADNAAKRKIVDIDRGLFLVRYGEAADAERPPLVRVSFDPPGVANGAMTILHPDAREAVLTGPGTALAVRATAPAKLLIEVSAREPNGSTAATVQVEALNFGEFEGGALAGIVTPAPANAGQVRVLGHIAGQGDVVVPAGQWLAGPSAPSRVEGVQIDWVDRPDNVELRYAVKSARAAGASPMVEAGKFAGTRGRALPVTGLVLELGGEAAAKHVLSVEALFLGSPTMRSTGQRIVASGPTGREPLVGLRVALDAMPAAVPAPVVEVAPRPSSKVRVFRGRAKVAQAASR